jgi:lysyl-tRNA synthetase class 2
MEDKMQVALRGDLTHSVIPSPFDIVECSGIYNYSDTKEPTLWASDVKIHSKCEGDLPSFKGIKDGKLTVEKRFLQVITDDGLKETLMIRSHVIKSLRKFLWDQDFIEIETPILSVIASGANASPFITKSEALNSDFYLRIATETALKKAVVSGCDRVFEIGKIFRNEGIDKTHNPEFTSVEIYSAYRTLNDMKTLLVNFISNWKDNQTYTEKTHSDLIREYGDDFGDYLESPTFVSGYPLCESLPDGTSNRFEFFANGMEIANAYQEVTDWETQQRQLGGKNDDGLSEALKYGCPPMAGMGIGIDRLIMYLRDKRNISDVIFFPCKRNG